MTDGRADLEAKPEYGGALYNARMKDEPLWTAPTSGDADPLREAAQAYIDWRDQRLAQWNAVARHDHEHGMTPCPEWDELTSEPFDKDQQLDDAIRAALAAPPSPVGLDEPTQLARAFDMVREAIEENESASRLSSTGGEPTP